MRTIIARSGILMAAALWAGSASAADFSFTGTFTEDDDIALFAFTVGSPSTVTLQSLSYAGGTNAAGQTIAAGGFDPILALFDSAGNLIDQDDDGSSVVDPETGRSWDVFLQELLQPGSYTVAVTQYDNFANATLGAGFDRQGQGNFTVNFGCPEAQPAFNDVSGGTGCGRTANWAFDILGVQTAVIPGTPGGGGGVVPEPSTWAMMLIGFALTGCALRRGRRPQPILA